LSVLQHLILGMNAHINLDLGIAAAEVAPGDAIFDLEADFNRINDVLASLLPVVEAQVRQLSPTLDDLTELADRLDNLDDRAGNFSIEKARDGAWRFALRLASLDSVVARHLAIGARDAATRAVGLGFQMPGPLADLLGGPDRIDIVAHVRALAHGETGLADA
jgi:hypothetical protein